MSQGREKAVVIEPDRAILGAREASICLITIGKPVIDSHGPTGREQHVALQPTVRLPCRGDMVETWFSAGVGSRQE